MKKVYCAKDPLMIGHLRNVLATFGIACLTKNLDLSSAAGELPPIDCWPELWVDDDQVASAKSILKKTMAPLQSVKKPWTCGGCGEEIEGQFSECWSCGRGRSRGRARRGVVVSLSEFLRNR
ncbi:MAG: DUF2007 domain-containing protein [Candidatus Binatia bacterium]